MAIMAAPDLRLTVRVGANVRNGSGADFGSAVGSCPSRRTYVTDEPPPVIASRIVFKRGCITHAPIIQ